ncbi:hypothetical protein IEQ34_003353 [Dendrobium chrysotoxum]|uniref:Uncharacterized protein n=1 Tax=Dendrobium chrysotoxum TaxID=161865 RepID=A0AAV7HLX0_DENCH|nr:hypothetical protein IEQ34_003353 [Dendrobium chrysotoxum]
MAPASTDKSVDLPAPLGPTMARSSPGLASQGVTHAYSAQAGKDDRLREFRVVLRVECVKLALCVFALDLAVDDAYALNNIDFLSVKYHRTGPAGSTVNRSGDQSDPTHRTGFTSNRIEPAIQPVNR